MLGFFLMFAVSSCWMLCTCPREEGNVWLENGNTNTIEKPRATCSLSYHWDLAVSFGFSTRRRVRVILVLWMNGSFRMIILLLFLCMGYSTFWSDGRETIRRGALQWNYFIAHLNNNSIIRFALHCLQPEKQRWFFAFYYTRETRPTFYQ